MSVKKILKKEWENEDKFKEIYNSDIGLKPVSELYNKYMIYDFDVYVKNIQSAIDIYERENKIYKKENKFNELNIACNSSNIIDEIKKIANSKILTNDLNFQIHIYDIEGMKYLLNELEKIDLNTITKLKLNNKNIKLHFIVTNRIADLKNINSLNIKNNKFVENFPIVIKYIINDKTFKLIADTCIILYQKTKGILRFFEFELNYYSLESLKLYELSELEFNFNFIYKWLSTTSNEPNKMILLNLFNNRVRKPLYVDDNGDVRILKMENLLFNYHNVETGEDIDYYNLSLFHFIKNIEPKNFIRHMYGNDTNLLYSMIDYSYNYKNNSAMQNLSPEVETLQMILIKSFYPTK